MKKFSQKISVFVGLALLLGAATASASTIDLSPTTVSVSNGQTVTVTLSVDAGTANVSSVESSISYPANLLTPSGFTLAPSWIALTQPGYDQMSGGTVIKTAGYPGGFTGVKAFGTLSFTAIADGTATIAVNGSSIAYDGSNQNTISGTQGSATVTVSEAAPAVTSPATPVAPATTTGTQPAAEQNQTTVSQGTAPAQATGAQLTPDTALGAGAATPAIPLGANAGGAGFHMSGWLWLLALLVLVGLIVLGRYLYGRRTKTVVTTTNTTPKQ